MSDPASRPEPEAADISAAEWDVWRSFYRMRRQLDHALESRLQRNADISGAEYDILFALSEAPSRQLRARELGASLGWEKSRLSHQVTRMEKRGLVERTECDTDARGTWIGVTDAGGLAILGAMRDHAANIRTYFLDVATPDELRALSALSSRVLQTIEPPSCDDDAEASTATALSA
jgi:DNA-binding MarR family transcriptional regulator